MSTVIITATPLAAPTAGPSLKHSGPNVAYVRPEFLDLKPRWDLVRDCVAGDQQVKKAGDRYLPRPNASDTSAENEARYELYLARAVFYNVTGRTLNGLVGQVFADDPKLTVPPLLELFEEDVDGGGVSIYQQSQKALAHGLCFGRAGLLVDYPAVAGPVTVKDLADAKVRPTITLVDPWDVINWRTITVGGLVKLALVVITESYVIDDDGFEQELDDQWRVLRLDDNGLYVHEEWIRDPNNREEFILKVMEGEEARYFPTDSSGKRLDHIPFTFIGAKNNDPSPDLPPLYDLAALNIAHYRNSADYEEASFICGQPTPVLTGLTEEWVRDVLKGQVHLGSRVAIPLPPQATAALLQAEPNIMPKEAMEHKELQMKSIGAKLVEQSKTQRTATEASNENASETSILAAVTQNVSEAYEMALRWALDFVAVQDTTDLQYELNTDFNMQTMDAPARAQLAAEWMGRQITFSEMRSALRKSGIASLEDEEARSELESEDTLLPIAPGDTAAHADAAGQMASATSEAESGA